MLCIGDRDRNVGFFDRVVRAIVGGVVLALIGYLHINTLLSSELILLQIALFAISFVCVVSAVTGTCGIYTVLGIDTCSGCDDDSPRNSWEPT